MMKNFPGYGLAAAALVAVVALLSGWVSAQDSVRGMVLPPRVRTVAARRYTVVSSETATVLLDETTGQTWLLAGVEWLPIEGGPQSPEASVAATEYGGSTPGDGGWARLSPFTEVICQPDDTILVRIDDEERMLQLVSIDEIPAGEIVATCRNKYDDSWEKRFVEDIVEVLAGMDRPPGETVKLVLRDSESGATRTIDEAPMTHENRRRVYAARNRDQ